MEMYDALFQEGMELEIDGHPFYIESCTPGECYNRRELQRINIIGGTQVVTKGAYLPRDWTIVTHVRCDPDRPDVYDKIFQAMMNKPCEVISPEVGGVLNAEVVVKREHDTPKYLKVTFTITELPSWQSNIPGEEFSKPADRLMTESEKAEYEERKAKKLAMASAEEDSSDS